jgi:hypothetical protein
MTGTIRITHNQQALPITQGEGKSLVIDQDLSKAESKVILKNLARSLVDSNNKVSNSQLKVQLKENGAWLRASNLGHGSNAARSVFQALIKKGYGETGEQLLQSHLQEIRGKTIEADSFVKLFIELADREGDLAQDDALRQARVEHAKFTPPSKISINPHEPTPPGKNINGGRLNLTQIPAEIKAGLNGNFGQATAPFIAWAIRSGQIDLGIADIARHQVDVKELERSGASTLRLFRVKIDNQPQFIVKECGTTLDDDNGGKVYIGYSQKTGGVWTDPQSFEDERLARIEEGSLGSVGTIAGPEGSQFGLAHTVSTCRYEPGQNAKVSQYGIIEESVNGKVEHQLSVVRHAAGEPAYAIFSSNEFTPEDRAKTAKLLGQGLGAFHKTSIKPAPQEGSGFRTLIHGDFHPANIFVDREKKTVTAIDLAGSIGNFEEATYDHQFRPTTVKKDPAGWDPIRELKRAVSQGQLFEAAKAEPVLIEQFLAGYAENFKDIQDANGQPRFTAQSLRALINSYSGDTAPLT